MDKFDTQEQTQDVSSLTPNTTEQLEDEKMNEESLKSAPTIPQKSQFQQSPKALSKPIPQQVFGRNTGQTNMSYSGIKRRRQQVMNETQEEYLEQDLFDALKRQDYVMNGKDTRADERADANSQGDYFDMPDDDSDAGSMNSYEIAQTYQSILNNVKNNPGILKGYLDLEESNLEPVNDLD